MTLVWFIRLSQSTLHKSILGIHQRRLKARAHKFADTRILFETRSNDLISILKSLNDFLNLLVVLQVLDRKITCRIFISDVGVLLKQHLDAVDALLQLCTMVDVDMSGNVRIGLLIHLHHSLKKLLDTLTATADRRHDRHTEKITQLLDIQLITLRSKLVIHVQSHHHTKVHVDELGSQVKVSLKIGRVDDIDHHVRHVVDQIATHIKFLRTVGRKRICTRKVNDDEPIAAIFKCTLLGIHSHTAVVAHMLMTAGSNVEKRSLTAVRISHQGHLDDLAALLCKRTHLTLDPLLFRLKGRARLQGMQCL